MGEATIRDVARRAEVSVASVSRALNGLNNVRGETRERIVAAAKELGYVPHAGARSLSLARTRAIGVVLPDLHGEFFSECVRGMDREASRRGYLLLLSNMHDDSEQAAVALRAMRGRVDGLLVMAPHITLESLERALPAALPAVLINAPGEVTSRPSLRLDNRAGAEAMVRHLLANGYRHIVHIAGPEGNVDARERLQGFRDALAELAPDMPVRIIAGDFNEEAGEAAARDDPGERRAMRRGVRRQRHDGDRLPPHAAPSRQKRARGYRRRRLRRRAAGALPGAHYDRGAHRRDRRARGLAADRHARRQGPGCSHRNARARADRARHHRRARRRIRTWLSASPFSRGHRGARCAFCVPAL